MARAGKAARNKARELEANSVNAIGLAIFGWGFVQPVLIEATAQEALARFVFSSIIMFALHLWAKFLLKDLED